MSKLQYIIPTHLYIKPKLIYIIPTRQNLIILYQHVYVIDHILQL